MLIQQYRVATVVRWTVCITKHRLVIYHSCVLSDTVSEVTGYIAVVCQGQLRLQIIRTGELGSFEKTSFKSTKTFEKWAHQSREDMGLEP